MGNNNLQARLEPVCFFLRPTNQADYTALYSRHHPVRLLYNSYSLCSTLDRGEKSFQKPPIYCYKDTIYQKLAFELLSTLPSAPFLPVLHILMSCCWFMTFAFIYSLSAFFSLYLFDHFTFVRSLRSRICLCFPPGTITMTPTQILQHRTLAHALLVTQYYHNT